MQRRSRHHWPSLVADARLRIDLHRRWLGYQVRRDAWTIQEHLHGTHRLWLAIEGVADLRIAGEPVRLGPGMALWLPPGVRYACAWPALWRFHEAVFDVHEGSQALTVREGALVVERAWEVAPLMEALADRARDGAVVRTPVVRHLLAACLAELLALQARPAPLRTLPAGQRDRLCRLVRERIADQLAPDDLARAVGLSGDYFARLFRASFGVSPRQWLADERIRAAARLLHDGAMTPARAAETLGFRDLSQFGRRFRAVMGCAPRRWVRQD